MFSLQNRTEAAFSIMRVSPESECWEVSFPEKLMPYSTDTGYIKLRKACQDKGFQESLTLQFDTRHHEPGRFTIPVRRRLLGE